MKIMNAKIEKVTVGMDDRDQLSARITFAGRCLSYFWVFVLTNPIDSQRLIKLLEYTETNDLQKLNGKIVRIVDHGCFFRGFGDPIEDKFVPTFGEELQEVSEEGFNKLLGKPF